MTSIKTAAEWNRESEEARMASVINEVKARPHEGDIFRRWKGSLFVSQDGEVRSVTEKQFLRKKYKEGVDVTKNYSSEEIHQVVKQLFPLQFEKLFED